MRTATTSCRLLSGCVCSSGPPCSVWKKSVIKLITFCKHSKIYTKIPSCGVESLDTDGQAEYNRRLRRLCVVAKHCILARSVARACLCAPRQLIIALRQRETAYVMSGQARPGPLRYCPFNYSRFCRIPLMKIITRPTQCYATEQRQDTKSPVL